MQKIVLVLVLLFAPLSIGYAQYGSQYLANLGYEDTNWYLNSILINNIEQAAEASKPETKAPKTKVPKNTITEERPSSSTAERLANGYPVAARAGAIKVFREMLQGYGQLESRFDIPKGDTAGAAAALIAGSYMAYNNTDLSDEHFAALVKQMRSVVADDEKYAAASVTQQRDTFEEMATLAMFLAATQMALKERPDPSVESNMKRAGKQYLEKLTGVGADQIVIGTKGISLR